MNYELISFWSQVAAFVLFVAFIIWGWARFITPAVRVAQTATNERIATAQRHRDDMLKSLDVLQIEIETAKLDAAAIEARSADQAKREHDAIVAEAQAEGERLLANAALELDRQRAAARDQLRVSLLEDALILARERAKARLTQGAADKLIADFASAARNVN